MRMQARFLVRRQGDAHIARAAILAEAQPHGQRFEHGRLAAAVLAHEKRHVAVEVHVHEVADGGNGERIVVQVDDGVVAQRGALQIRFFTQRHGRFHEWPGGGPTNTSVAQIRRMRQYVAPSLCGALISS